MRISAKRRLGAALLTGTLGAGALIAIGPAGGAAVPPSTTTCTAGLLDFPDVGSESLRLVRGGEAMRLRYQARDDDATISCDNPAHPLHGAAMVDQRTDVVLGFTPDVGTSRGEVRGRSAIRFEDAAGSEEVYVFRGRVGGQSECIGNSCTATMPFQGRGPGGSRISGTTQVGFILDDVFSPGIRSEMLNIVMTVRDR